MAKLTMQKITVCVVVDENGDYEVAGNAEDAFARFEENIGELDGSLGFRRVVVELTIPLPEAVEIVAEVPVVEEPEPVVTVR